MRVTLLHQFVPEGASEDERDVLVQVEAISKSLAELGHTPDVLACTLDLACVADELSTRRPDVVFNLVESLAGTDALQCLAALVVESLGLRMTGSSGAAILNSGRKGFAKSLLRAAGLPTPAWHDVASLRQADDVAGRFILKPVLEHASLGMTDADVVDVRDAGELAERLAAKQAVLGKPVFAEAFIDGREFNLSLMDGPGGVQVLPPAEIRFVDFPAGKPRIVGSAAKWDEESFEYGATVRSFAMGQGDQPLLDEMARVASACWNVLELRGYARVDFRVDEAGRPWILEANANPCLSPDAGFAAAAERAGMGYTAMIERIIDSALVPSRAT